MTHFDWRSGLEVLDEDRCWEYIEPGGVGRLAVSVDNAPDIFPVNYIVDDRTIVINTAPGTKLAAAVLGRSVAFEVDWFDRERRTGWSVVILGHAAEAEGLDEVMAAQALELEPWADGEKLRYLRIEPTQITGRRLVKRA